MWFSWVLGWIFWYIFLPNAISEVWALLDSSFTCSNTLHVVLTHRAAHLWDFLRPPSVWVKVFGRASKNSFFCGLYFTIRLTAKKIAHSCAHPGQSTNLDIARTFFKHRRIVFIFFCVLGINRLVSQQAYMGFSLGSTFVIILFLKWISCNKCKKKKIFPFHSFLFI